MVKLISGSTNPTIIRNGSKMLYIVGPFYAILGVLIQTRFALQGIGSKLIPMISSVIELVGKILFVYIFIPMFGYDAVCWCEPLIWVAMTAQLLYAFNTNKYVKEIRAQQKAAAAA
jgi:Na+-driven multidrug efflux pump